MYRSVAAGAAAGIEQERLNSAARIHSANAISIANANANSNVNTNTFLASTNNTSAEIDAQNRSEYPIPVLRGRIVRDHSSVHRRPADGPNLAPSDLTVDVLEEQRQEQQILNDESAWEDEFDARDHDEDDGELETIIESYLKEMLLASDVTIISSAYLSLSREYHIRFSQLHLGAPLSVVRTVLISKILNNFLMLLIITSIVLLCLETDPKLGVMDFTYIFGAEFRKQFPRLSYRLNKIYQLLYTITFSDNKAKRINTGVQRTPTLNLLQRRLRSNPTEQSKSLFDDPELVARHNKSRELHGLDNFGGGGSGRDTPPAVTFNVDSDDIHPRELRVRRQVSSESSFAQNNAATAPATTALQPIVKSTVKLQYLDNDYVRWIWLLIDVIATLPFAIEVCVYGVQSLPHG
ncbi:hypothetical protein HK100_007751, partial [Physocladia obscura]